MSHLQRVFSSLLG